jgi:hypothetical protein
VADEASRAALLRGALTDEVAFTGFEAFAGLAVPPAAGGKKRAPRADEKKRDERQARERELRRELSGARTALKEAERDLKSAARARAEAAERVDELEAALARLERDRP